MILFRVIFFSNNLNFFSYFDFLPETRLRQFLKDFDFKFFLIINITPFSETPKSLCIFSNEDLSCHAFFMIYYLGIFVAPVSERTILPSLIIYTAKTACREPSLKETKK